MPQRPLSRDDFQAAYDEMAPRVAATAPAGLSREQFNDLVIEEIERSRGGDDGGDVSLMQRAIPMAMRIVPSVAGGFIGSLVGPLGTVAGGAGGAALGEYAAETYEQLTGQREDINPTQLVTQTALGAIPMGKVAGSTIGQIAARRALQGAGMGALSAGATEYAETGEMPSLGNVAMGTALGGVLGGAVGNVEGRGLRRIGRLDVPDAPVREPAGLLPAGARFQADDAGRVGPMGADFPAQGAVQRDPSSGRSVRAAVSSFDATGQPIYSSDPAAVSVSRPVSGALPPGRTPIITEPPPGSVPIVRPDPSGGRTVRAAVVDFDSQGRPVYSSDPNAVSVTRPVRGELAAGPRFVAGPSGVVAAADDVQRLSAETPGAVAPVSRPAPDLSGGRSVPAAVLAREVDPSVPAKSAIRVAQYASDPNAVDVPFLNTEDVQLLERAGVDLDVFTPQRGRLIRDPNDVNSSVYAHGGRGSYVAEDIRILSGQNVGNDAIEAARRHLVEGGPPTNRLHTAWLDWLRGVRAGERGYHAPQVPDEWVKASSPAIDDYDRFAAMFDDIDAPASGGVREPGEEGFIAGQLVRRGGGALAGGLIGAASGDDPQERIERGLLGATAGAMLPSLVRGLQRRQPPAATVAGRRIVDMSDLRPVGPRAGAAAPGTLPRASQTVSGTARRDPLRGTEPFLSRFSNPLVREGVEERLIANAGFDVQRRGVLDADTIGRLAEEVRVDVSRVLPRGSTLSTEGVVAYTRAVQSTMTRVRELAARVTSGAATDQDVVALAAAQADADVVLKSLMGARSEAGRALAAFRMFDALLETGDVNLYRQAASGLREDAARLAQQVGEIRDPVAAYRFLQSQGRPTIADKMRGYFYSSILSGIKTHERNILGNAASILTRFTSTPFTAGLDAAQAAASGRQREVFLDEMKPAAVGAVAGMQKGMRSLAFTLKHGVSPDALQRSVSSAVESGKFDLPRVEFAGGGGNPFNWPGRALDAADAFFRTTARDMELYASAWSQARREGLKGARLIDRAAALRTDAALQKAAQEAAVEAVYQTKLSGAMGGLQAALNRVPGAYFIIPFIKTPTNIVRMGVQASPAGFVTAAGRQGGRAGAQARGFAAMGTVALAPLAWLAATNRLSGSGPRDPAERAALMEAGWRPNSVRVGEQWVEYSLFQPISVQAALVANAYEAWRREGATETGAADIPVRIGEGLFRAGRSLMEQSFLSGLYDFMSAVEDPERFFSQWGGRTAHSLTPFAGLQRTVTQATDPTIRQARTAEDVFKANVPGLSRTVQPRLTRFGEPTQRPGGTRAAFDALNISPALSDPVAQELARLDVSVSLPTDRIALPEGATLSAEQSLALRQEKGQQLYGRLARLIAIPGYQRLPDALKRNALERVKESSNRGVNAGARRRVALDQRRLRREALIQQMQGGAQ